MYIIWLMSIFLLANSNLYSSASTSSELITESDSDSMPRILTTAPASPTLDDGRNAQLQAAIAGLEKDLKIARQQAKENERLVQTVLDDLNQKLKIQEATCARQMERAESLEQELQNRGISRPSSYVPRELPAVAIPNQQHVSCIQKHPYRSCLTGTLAGLGVGCVVTSLVFLGKIY